MKASLCLLLLSVCNGCGPPVPQPAGGEATVAVRFDPPAATDQVTNVTRLVLNGAEPHGPLSLFQGTLSSYYLGKLKTEPLPDALLERQVPLMSWSNDTELSITPLRALVPGDYSLASVDGLIATFTVSNVLPLLSRVWPPATSKGSPQFAVYCAASEVPLALPDDSALTLEPQALSVVAAPGADNDGLFAERCLHFGSEATLTGDEIALAPPTLGAFALEPALFGAPAGPTAPVVCAPEEVEFGPGCASAADDRLLVRTPDDEIFWTIHTEHGALIQVTRGGAPLGVPGLTPSSREHVWGSARDTRGAAAFDLELTTAPAQARPILNEALADALGPEPRSEWVELYNAGTLAVELSQYALEDNGGHTPLPRASLLPKAYALLVRDDFEPNGSDPAPRAGTLLLRVPALGKSGLANSGERLALVGAEGREVSVLPALAGKAGQSLSRVRPDAPDDDPQSFSFGTPTPGSANAALSTSTTP